MQNRQYDLGVIVGRFQILHRGHGIIIREALRICNTVGILVGSSQEKGSYKNPFSYEERREFLLRVFPELLIAPLPDIGVGNCPAWGEYVLTNAVKYFGRKPDVFISGEEERRVSWFTGSTAEVTVPKTIDISSSKMKEYIIRDDRISWNRYIEPALMEKYSDMRNIILSTVNNKETESM